MMNLINPVKISYQNLIAEKTRSFLTILGVIIGVAAVIIIMAIGQSAQELIINQVKGVGSNLIAVLPGASNEDGPPASAMGITIKTLELDDLEAILNSESGRFIEAAAGYSNGTAMVSKNSVSKNISIIGTTSDYVDVEDSSVERGRFFYQDEDQGMPKIAVLGSQAAKEFFGNNDPIGKKIKIEKQQLTVVGVMEERGATAFGVSDQDSAIMIPLNTAQKLILGRDYLNFIRIKVESTENIAFVKNQIKETMRKSHNIKESEEDDFSVRDLSSAIETITQITDVLRYFLITIGTISLIVGGVGIMNVMLISVNQRVKEIGLRKAVGAKNKDLLLQFLIESTTVSLAGGIIGIILGVTISYLIAVAVNLLGYEWQFMISFWSIIIAFLISILVGVLFGMYPALKASKISPMEALRYE